MRRGAYERLETCIVQCVMSSAMQPGTMPMAYRQSRSPITSHRIVYRIPMKACQQKMCTASFPETRRRYSLCPPCSAHLPSFKVPLLIPFVALPPFSLQEASTCAFVRTRWPSPFVKLRRRRGGSWNAAWKCGMAATPRHFKPAQ